MHGLTPRGSQCYCNDGNEHIVDFKKKKKKVPGSRIESVYFSGFTFAFVVVCVSPVWMHLFPVYLPHLAPPRPGIWCLPLPSVDKLFVQLSDFTCLLACCFLYV